jgi:ribosomal protein S18 acetylase RimI-like enzyme
MKEIKHPSIVLKEKLDQDDYNDINELKNICLSQDKTSLKLELDYKLSRSERSSRRLESINEFMYYEKDMLIGYIGICCFGGDALEINGMVHPNYRRMGIFNRLFSLVKDEWDKRQAEKVLLLSDHNSNSGLEFIKAAGANYAYSEYEMFLKNDAEKKLYANNVILRKATNADAREIAWQNSIYFNEEFKEEQIFMPEEEEESGTTIYMAEVDGKIIGKVHLSIEGDIGGIYGVGVLPEYRTKGYGREIITTAVEKLKEKGLKDIMLQVEAKNSNALNLYKSCGFEETSTMDYYEYTVKERNRFR